MKNDRALPIWVSPIRAQDLIRGPELRQYIDRVEVWLEIPWGHDDGMWKAFELRGVHASLFTSYESCTAAHVEAYDRILELPDMGFPVTLENVPPNVRHLRWFVDDIGCFDFLAVTFVEGIPPETPRDEAAAEAIDEPRPLHWNRE